MAIAVLYREEMREYDFGPGHPFRGDRFDIFPVFLRNNVPQDDNYRIIKAEPATEEDLLLVSTKGYIDFTREFYKAAHLGVANYSRFHEYQSGDNLPVGRPGNIEDGARMVVGQAKLACQLVQEGKYQKAVCIGGGMHHAKPNYGEGFCLYNDVAFAALYLINKYNLERVLVLDTDAHGGNGTMEYFYEEPRVLFIDFHQDPHTLYPGTGFVSQIGAGAGKGFTINIALPPHAGYDSYKLGFEEIVEPVVKEFRPQIIIRNGGSDPHFSDGLTNLGLPVKGFRMIGEKVRAMADICDGKVVDLIGSGYNKEVLPYGWLALMSGLAGMNIEVSDPEPVPDRFATDSVLPQTKTVIAELKRLLKPYWKCLA